MKTGLRRNLAKLSLLFGGVLNTPQLLLQLTKIQRFGIGDDLGTGFGKQLTIFLRHYNIY